MSFCEGLKNVGSHKMHEICDFSAPCCILVIERIKNYTAVYVYISAEGVVLEGISSIYNWGIDVFFLLFCFLLKKCLIILEVFQGPFNP